MNEYRVRWLYADDEIIVRACDPESAALEWAKRFDHARDYDIARGSNRFAVVTACADGSKTQWLVSGYMEPTYFIEEGRP